MQYLITPLLEVLNPTNTVSRNRLLSFAIGNSEAEIYNCLIAKHVYYNNLGKLTEGGWFYSTVKDLHLSSGYAEDAQKTAIRHLIKHGLIESELKGLPAKRYFFLFSRRSSLCCSCKSCVSGRFFSARSCSRVFGFVIVIDLLFGFWG